MNLTADISGADWRAPGGTMSGWLDICGIGRRFGAAEVLQDVSLHVDRGEVVCLVGPSGCGKSTLLRLVAGVDLPDTGTITLDGTRLSGGGAFVEPERRAIGLMFQDYALFPHLSVLANVMFGLRHLSRSEARMLADRVIARLGIAHLADRFPHMLSGGEQQRVALARALAPEPRVMLMDEPFSNLDRNLRDGVREETLALLRDLGTTTLIVTHDPEEALSAGNRVALMKGGRIVQFDTGRAIYDRPVSAYAAEFFGQCNRLDANCIDGYAVTPVGRFAARGLSNGPVSVLIRPHAISLVDEAKGPCATVLNVTLMGEIQQLGVSVAGLASPLKIRTTDRHLPAIGTRFGLSIESTGVFVFPQGE